MTIPNEPSAFASLMLRMERESFEQSYAEPTDTTPAHALVRGADGKQHFLHLASLFAEPWETRNDGINQAIAAMMRACIENQADAISFVTETWMLERLTPSNPTPNRSWEDHPDRIEALFVIIDEIDRDEVAYSARISHVDGRRKLGPWQQADNPEGKFSNLLQRAAVFWAAFQGGARA